MQALSVHLNNFGSTLIHENECHFFIAITKKVRNNKMIVIYLKTFITEFLLDIIIKPPLYI